jgi:hypothetical protein
MEPEQVFQPSTGGESSSSHVASRKTQRIPFGRGTSSQQGNSARSANISKLQVEHSNIRTGKCAL